MSGQYSLGTFRPWRGWLSCHREAASPQFSGWIHGIRPASSGSSGLSPYALRCRQPEKEVWWLAFVPKISANEEKIRGAQYKPPNDYKLTGACRPSGTE